MKLKEICQETGLTKRTARFYEAQELLRPRKTYKNGREYREYTEENLSQLLEIATLRRARFTIREIREMEQDPGKIPEIFSEYRKSLLRQQRELGMLLAAAEEVDCAKVHSRQALSGLLSEKLGSVSLPAVDTQPHFRHLDEQEAHLAPSRRARLSRRDWQVRADLQRAVVVSMDMGMAFRKNPRELSLSNEQKMAVINILRDDREL